VPDLTEGEEYEYRVAAVTDAGVGEFSNATQPVKAERKKRIYQSSSRRARPVAVVVVVHCGKMSAYPRIFCVRVFTYFNGIGSVYVCRRESTEFPRVTETKVYGTNSIKI